MSKTGIRIAVRVRPSKNPSGFWSMSREKGTLEFDIPREVADGLVNNSRTTHTFKFDNLISMDATQSDVFDELARPVIDDALNGFNATLFAYGQTGSGKTFTITGGAERYVDRGIIPRTISYIFAEFERRANEASASGGGAQHTMHVSYLEIYNESGYDLLDPSHDNKALEDLPRVTILEDEDGNCHLRNLSMHQAANEEEALNLLFLGDTNRAIAETPMNLASSRSHCVFTLSLSCREGGADVVRRSKLHLVDLAGSERVHKTNAAGKVLSEAKFINTSLHYLEMVIVALQERDGRKGRSHIPYRNSMMTSVLRDSLGGNCKTAMVATVSGEREQTEESISTCRFAQRVAMVKNDANINEEIDPALVIRRLKSEVSELQQEVLMLRGDVDEGAEASEEEAAYLRRQCAQYVDDRDPCANLDVGKLTFSKIKDCFAILKEMVLRERAKGGDRDGVTTVAGRGTDSRVAELTASLQQRDQEVAVLSSMLQQLQQKYGVPGSPLQLPVTAATSSYAAQSAHGQAGSSTSAAPGHNGGAARVVGPGAAPGQTSLPPNEVLADPSAAFEHFRSAHPRNRAIEENKRVLKDKFDAAKRIGQQVNEARGRVSELKRAVEARRRQLAASAISASESASDGSKPLSDAVIAGEEDEEEKALLIQIEECKTQYKRAFGQLREQKKEIDHVQALLEKSRRRMQKEFERWYATVSTHLPDDAGVRSERQGQGEGHSQAAVMQPPTVPSATNSTAGADTAHGVAALSDVAEAKNAWCEDDVRGDGTSAGNGPALTGNKDVDEDIVAFYRAKEDLLRRRALAAKK